MVDFHLATGSITDHDESKRFGHARVIDTVPRTTIGEEIPTCHPGLHSTEENPRSEGDDSLTESCSGKSSHDEEYYENSFEMDDGMRRMAGKPCSVTMPIVVEVIPRRGHYYSDDPLFQGVCLYNGCMTDTQREEMDYKLSIDNKEAPRRAAASSFSSIFSSIFSGHA